MIELDDLGDNNHPEFADWQKMNLSDMKAVLSHCLDWFYFNQDQKWNNTIKNDLDLQGNEI